MTTDSLIRSDQPKSPASSACPTVLAAVEAALAGLDYGSLALVVHAGKVVQLDVTSRRRF